MQSDVLRRIGEGEDELLVPLLELSKFVIRNREDRAASCGFEEREKKNEFRRQVAKIEKKK